MGNISNIAIGVIFCWFADNLLKCRSRILAYPLAVLVLGIAGPELCSHIPTQFSFVISHITFYLFLQFLFKAKTKERILAYCLCFIAVSAANTSVPLIFGVVDAELLLNSPVYILLFVLLTIALLFLIIRTWKSISFVISNVRFMTFFLLPISQFATVFLMVFYTSKNAVSEAQFYSQALYDRGFSISFFSVLVVSLFADGFFIQAFARMATDIKERERLQSLELESRMTYDYIKSMESDVTEMRQYRHDFINLLTTVQLAIESDSEKGKKDALNMVRQMTQEIHDLSGGRYCGNNLVNCILTHEQSRMEKEGIACDFRAELGEELHVSELDLCRLLTNLLDNAAESCCRVEDRSERRVYSNMRVDDGFLYITVRNTCPKGEFSSETDKADKENHGLGLGIMREIVGRYEGDLIISAEDSTVTATATLAWK